MPIFVIWIFLNLVFNPGKVGEQIGLEFLAICRGCGTEAHHGVMPV